MNKQFFTALAMILSIFSLETKATNIIDFHAHPIPESFKQGLSDMGIDPLEADGFPLPEWNEKDHIEFMDKTGIKLTVLSIPAPHINNGDNEKSRKYARLINEEMKQIVDKSNGRFKFAAVLPTPDVKGTIDEINYSFDKLGAVAVKISTNSNGIYLGDPELDPIFEELNKRKAIVIIHPSRAQKFPNKVVTGDVAAALFEYPADTTRAVLNMAANNLMIKYPEIKFIVPHTGSFLPYMLERFKSITSILIAKNQMKPVDVEANLKNLYFDIAGDPEPIALDMLLKITNSDHILYGTDYPYTPTFILKTKKNHFENNEKYKSILSKIYYENGKKLLKNK